MRRGIVLVSVVCLYNKSSNMAAVALVLTGFLSFDRGRDRGCEGLFYLVFGDGQK